MLGVSLASMAFPGSKVLGNIWLWGGLALFGGITLYDVQKILYKAKTQQEFDPIMNGLEIYLDAARFLITFSGSKK